jgi:hypothetical protein
MVKGISRQVIVVQAPDPKLFEQAIFILKDNALGEGVTEEVLLKEARQAIRGFENTGKKRHSWSGAFWAGSGAAVMGIVWLLSTLV